ncbi:hypothetical protein LGQ02_09495 [Bacillus shivajii]|uniref:hypothetical protein n=1 Tax=Bacillus shivajii TaxID=1983719 RepID=UPI001CFAF89F|nr:hypothetical protein [Bacillus shivajii]UCZ54955.1 hypothetical protein LGQ02_09495 [Bacillus shivajii]
MTKRNNQGSENQSSPKRGGQLDTEFGQEVATGDNSKGNHRNAKRNSKADLKNPNKKK